MPTFGEFLSFAKVFAMAFGNNQITITDAERESAFEFLKSMADQSNSWSQEDKEYYKMMVDFGNQLTKH